ncbi:MerR family transcriptional regulator [Ideonella azotifigens]|uniref:MerR family transcriptional regulator n=1 Tax=Ideonella azotifigens TaxID=513160 RepID=A0ABN1JWU4_9BURK|nr:MerR family transcriptional regulator [Ideonella azotifigens]MCD2341223.1 MerR family transcriptional regulator [Ideonella azotifigens]
MHHAPRRPALQHELLGEAAFTAEDIARACGMALAWVHEHVAAGVLRVDAVEDDGLAASRRFGSITLLRARRIAQLELVFDADPQLAALTTDLIEDVAQLRRQLLLSRGGDGGEGDGGGNGN